MEKKTYLWPRSTRRSGFTILTIFSIPPWGAISSWSTPVTLFALANKVNYYEVTTDTGSLIKNKEQLNELKLLDLAH